MSAEPKTKEKSPVLVDETQVTEKSKDEMWDECVRLQEELERVQKQKKHFKLQRDNAQRCWDNSRRKLEESKARMREKLRLKQEAERSHRAEIYEHEQKLKQLKTAHHNEICELKMATVAASSNKQKQYVESEIRLQKKTHILQMDKQEKEFCTEINMRKLKQKHQDELQELRESYRAQIKETEAQYQKKKSSAFRKNQKEIETEVNEMFKTSKKHIASVSEEFDEDWSSIRDFSNISNIGDDKTEEKDRVKRCSAAAVKYLTELHQDICKERDMLQRLFKAENSRNTQLDRKLAAAVQENEHLTKSLSEAKSRLCESRQQLVFDMKVKNRSLKRAKKRTAHILEERRNVYLKKQQLELKCEQVQQECDKLQKRATEAILDVQQQSSLRDLVLERKIKAVTEIQEKEQLKLWVALAFGQGDQMAAKSIKELFEGKDSTIKALRHDLSEDLKEYDDLVKKATALGISVDKCFSRNDINKLIRSPTEKSADLIHKLTALCISEDSQGLNPAGAASRE